MGHVALEGECVVFVFPEHPDEEGNPRRVQWDEAAEADLIVQRIRTFDPARAHRFDPPT